MSGLVLRPGRPEDGTHLHALDREVWDPSHSPGPRPHGTSVPPDEAVRIVAELDTEVVGYVSLVPASPLASNAHVVMIDGLAVRPSARRRGVGAALLDAAVERARGDGARRVRLRVLATNEPALRLYERHGFVVEGVLAAEFHLDGEDVDDVLMARLVDAQ